SYRNSGTAYYLLSHYNQALIDLEKALALFEEKNDAHAIGSTLRNIGNVYHSMDLFEASINCYNKALLITRKENDLQGTAYNIGNIGHVYQKMGHFDQAKKYLVEGKELLEEINDQLGLSDLLNNFGMVRIACDEKEEGFKLLQHSLSVSTAIRHLRGMANANNSIGNYFLQHKNYSEALKNFRAALGIAEEIGELALITEILRSISDTCEQSGDDKGALAYYKQYEQRKSELQRYDHTILLETLQMKSALEKFNLEKENFRKENEELEKIRREVEIKNIELERLSIVARQTENSILILSADGTLEWVNASFERLNGLTLEEFKKEYGNTIYEVSNNPAIHSIIENCVRSKTTVRYEAANHLENGKVVWESSTLTPIFDSKGELFKLIIIDTDVTERKMQEEIVVQKNKDITDSIHYARYLQEAILPTQDGITEVFPESFIFFRPKDIVSGDFFWFSSAKDVALLAVADCTGHGVPGAFMSVVGNEMLNITVRDPSIKSPATTLNVLHEKVREVFTNRRGESTAQDGMDIGLMVWHFEESYLQYSGARRPLVLIRDGEAQSISGDRFSIGERYNTSEKQFAEKIVPVQSGDMLYLFSDGYADQFGGTTGKKFMYRNFVKLLTKISGLPVAEQKQELENTLIKWQGELEQVDDILVVGVRIP
ncbi:MAG TPA: tetratricopeptide repeat protein, partial [Bacteroidia bacterium]|nr:tetratricopeptide repeat protein [Bacteroidia bacterium]